MNPFVVFSVAVAASMLVISLAWRLAPRLGLVDVPNARKVHTTPVPRIGGWGITIAVLIPLILSFSPDPLLQSFVIGTLILFVFGVWDDAREIGHWTKFAGQFLAAGTVVYHGDLYVMRLPFVDAALSPAIGQPFTLFALVGTINAVNHSDGLDGLAGGECLLSLIAMALLGYLVGDPLVVGVALSGIGGILGFLRYNSYPARVFMGDSGSQVLGFTVGFLAVYITQIAHTAVSAALPLLLLGLPIADILVVLYQRIRAGMNWFKATRNHVHHRLLDLGLDHYETVVIIYSVQAVSVVAAVLMRYYSDFAVAAAYLGLIGGLFAALVAAESRRFRVRALTGRASRLSALVAAAARNRTVRMVPLTVVAAGVPVGLVGGMLWVAAVPRDIAIAAAVLGCVVVFELVRTRGTGSSLVRAVVYVAVVFCAYLITHYPGPGSVNAQRVALGALGALAVAIAAHVALAKARSFGATPTDYLIGFGAIALAAFGSIDTSSRGVAELVVCSTVLLYGCEVLYGSARRWWSPLNAATIGALATMALKGLL